MASESTVFTDAALLAIAKTIDWSQFHACLLLGDGAKITCDEDGKFHVNPINGQWTERLTLKGK
jgi:hypothetical protein